MLLLRNQFESVPNIGPKEHFLYGKHFLASIKSIKFPFRKISNDSYIDGRLFFFLAKFVCLFFLG